MSDEDFEIEHWFCNGCKTELEPLSVTFNENCAHCGHAAEWIKSTSVIRENEQLKAENEELKNAFKEAKGRLNQVLESAMKRTGFKIEYPDVLDLSLIHI